MAQDVFISYAHQDKPIADAVCARIEQRGVRCWMAPRDVRPGEHWPAAITAAIDGSGVMVLVYTKAYNESSHTLREVERAVAHGLHIIPFRVEAAPLSQSLEYLISMPHWLDALTPPMEAHLARLAEVVEAIVRAGATPASKRDTDASPPRAAGWRRWTWIASTLALVVIMGAALLAIMRGRSPASTPEPSVHGAVDPSKTTTEPTEPRPETITEGKPDATALTSGAATPPIQEPAPRPNSAPADNPLANASPPVQRPSPPAPRSELEAMVDRWKGQTLPLLIVWSGSGFWGGTRLDLTLHDRKGSEVTVDVTCGGERRDPVRLTIDGERLIGGSISEFAPGSERWGPGNRDSLSFERGVPDPGFTWAGVDREADIFQARSGNDYRAILVAPRTRTEWVSRRLFANNLGTGFGVAGEWLATKGGRRAFDVILGTQIVVPVGTLTGDQAWELRGEFVATMEELPFAVQDRLRIIVQLDPTAEKRVDPAHDADAFNRTIDEKSGGVEIKVDIPKGTDEVVLSTTGYHNMWNNLRLIPKHVSDEDRK